MAKPATRDGYSDQFTLDCERVLVTLMRGLGPWRDSLYLIGRWPSSNLAKAMNLSYASSERCVSVKRAT